MNDAPTTNGQAAPPEPAMPECLIPESVERFLADGLALKRWWEQASAANSFAECFELERVFNRPASSFGFYDQAQLERGPLPVMGNYQEMFYDQPRTPTAFRQEAAEWMRGQMREFALRYFMRVSDFREPEASADHDPQSAPPFLSSLSWRPQPAVGRVGFGFSQLYYKLRETGQIGRFYGADQYAIVDLREIGAKYEWIVVKVRIFDFKFTFRPFGAEAPELGLPLKEESYLVLSREFVTDQDRPQPGVLGEYGLGYAFIKNPVEGVLAYGPGEFDAAIELINFRVLESGEVRVRMAFVANRPKRIANVSLDPIDWGFRLADLFSLGMASRLLAPVKSAYSETPFRQGSFDPVYAYISLANTLTGDQAAKQWGISRERLEKEFLTRHFMQHYQTIVGSLLTWRQIPDWLDAQALPEWVVTGSSA
jgi:hypothetical protein